MEIPYEIWEEIAFCDTPNMLGVFNTLVRAIPKLGRKTLDSAFQDYVIERFELYKIKGWKIRLKINGKLHSVYDRPSVIYLDGSKSWHKNDLLHRDNDNPAYIGSDGLKEWRRNGKIHRDNDKPAHIRPNIQKWFQNDKLHRDNDKPAIINKNSFKEWWIDGKQHRDPDISGAHKPAVIRSDGTNEYWINGEKIDSLT